ncbi:phage tail protein [Pasteurellaceae bacterium LFhippo2]|nr:phage tail protein [Pasteurellaceae bacterium LFhippo2]
MAILDILQHNHKAPAVHLTVRPSAKAVKNGEKDISKIVTDRLIDLSLTDSRGFEADQLDITLGDEDGQLEMPARGAVLSLGLGWQGEPLIHKGEFTVDEVEHSGAPDKLTIRARSADLRGPLINAQERSFHNTTIGKIVKQIADENGLQAVVGKEFENYAIKHLDQTNESSINLLTRLAEEHDAISTVKSGRLLFMKAGKSQTASGKGLKEFIIKRDVGDSHTFSIAEGDNYKAVKAYWHDTATGKRGEVVWDENTDVKQVTKSTMKKKTVVQRGADGKPVKGADGKSVKQTVYVQGKGKKANEISQSKPITSDTEAIKTLRHTYASKQTAINACKRNFEKLQRGVATFSIDLAIGNAELIPETTVTVQGFKPQIDATTWLITQVTHKLSKGSGFTTSLEMELKTEE